MFRSETSSLYRRRLGRAICTRYPPWVHVCGGIIIGSLCSIISGWCKLSGKEFRRTQSAILVACDRSGFLLMEVRSARRESSDGSDDSYFERHRSRQMMRWKGIIPIPRCGMSKTWFYLETYLGIIVTEEALQRSEKFLDLLHRTQQGLSTP